MSTIVTRTGKGSALTTAEMDANLTNLNTDKLENIVEDTTPQLGGNLSLENYSIQNTAGNIDLYPNASTGAIEVKQGVGINLNAASSIFTTTTNENITISANGSGYILLNQAGSVVVTNTASSGYGVVTGATSTGIALTANAGAQAATDSKIQVTSGGGITVQAGSGSTLAMTGQDITLTGETSVSSLESYAEKIQALAPVSGTLTIDPTAGPIKYVIPNGNITINGFSSPVAGQTVSFLIDNSTYATSYTLTLGAAILVPGGTAPSLTASGNDLLTITCIDAATPVYIANVVNDFQ
jgi:hypothetical protein